MAEFRPYPKMARLHRDTIITEKIDGTNACVVVDGLNLYAQSRKRIITPEQDNFGFALWVQEHSEELMELGDGYHYGEWWGLGIQRGYDLDEKRFSLFNPDTENIPECCHVVPVLDRCTFSQAAIRAQLSMLERNGSQAAPGYGYPEGVVVYHAAARLAFKVTLENDEKPKGSRE
jgi:RNA ligase-like protein